jgi:hypothetical protein
MCAICWNDEIHHGILIPTNPSGCHLVDWSPDEWSIDCWSGGVGHARQAVQECEYVEVGAESEYVKDFFSADMASWPDPGVNRLDLYYLPNWLRKIVERDERAAMAAQETVLAPEEALALST